MGLVKRFNIEQTEIKIFNNSQFMNGHPLEHIIKIIENTTNKCKDYVIHSPILLINIVDEGSHGEHVINGNETRTGFYFSQEGQHNWIFLVGKVLLDFLHNGKAKLIESGLIHELRHFYDFNKSDTIKLYWKNKQKLQDAMLRLQEEWKRIGIFEKQKDFLKVWAFLRQYYSDLFRDFQVEGLARYAERQPKFEKKYYWNAFREAHKQAEFLKKWLLPGKLICSEERIKKLPIFVTASYEIGYFMVFLLMYHKIKTLDKIAQMTYSEFIRLFEETQIKNGEPVIVSVTSGRGILDYKKLLEEARKELLEHKV